MIKGKKPDFQDFTPHPEGRYNGITYSWKYVGENNYGNERAMLRIESIDCTIEDKSSDYVGQPYSVGIFHNISFGNHKKRSGNWMPHMQKLREMLMGDITLTDNQWYDFDPRDILGVRVRYKVKHEPKDNGDGVWVNIEIIENLEDQELGELFNEIEVVEPPESKPAEESKDEDLPLDTYSQAKRTPKPAPAPPKPKIDSNMAHPKQKSYAISVVELLTDKGLFDHTGKASWNEFLSKPDLSLEELQEEYVSLEEAAKDAGVKLPVAEMHPMSMEQDGLPL